MAELTITLPESLLNETHKAAEVSQKSLQGFVLQVLAERVQEQNGTVLANSHKTRVPKKANRPKRLDTTAKPNSNGWDGKRMKQDWAWIDLNNNLLGESYPGQWIIVYDQKVCGAHRDLGIAEKQATEQIGDIHKAGAIMYYVERDRYVG